MNPSSSSSLSIPSSSSCKRKSNPNSSDERPPCKRPKNDVFVNYSFDDAGKGFVSHLKGALDRQGFTISDHTMLPVGQDESSELWKAIQDSEIFVVVFSIHYALSVRCLDELVDLMECLSKLDGRKVLPIFYKVEPSDVRNQDGSFKEPFQAHGTKFDPERVQKWTRALKDSGQLCGLPLENGSEEEFIRNIVKELTKMQNPQELFDAESPVGIESRAYDLISKLRLRDPVFSMVVVFGISGSGKTAIVKAVFDRIVAEFDISCFIEDISYYKLRGPCWKVELQKDLISYLTEDDKMSTARHHNVLHKKINKLIARRKVLLVLDDVDKFEQLQALGIHRASFDHGSRIIVTTRDRQSLSTLPYTPYEIRLLNKMESFELFTQIAFGKDEPIDMNFVEEIVSRAGGLPLILEVWGRHFKCHERKRWPSVLETLKRIPHKDVQKKLQLSYDSLSERSKKLFLDIACFFVGKDKDLVCQSTTG